MDIPKKKLKSGQALPVLGFGTFMMGGGMGFADKSQDKEEIKAIKTALELGITHIDTAEVYGGGHSEELVAQAIKGFQREKLFITSKVWKENLAYEDVIKAAKGSLDRLQTDYLDLYLVHAPNPLIPLKETMSALDHLADRGLVKNIGVSNFSVEELKETLSLAKNQLLTNQIHYSLLTGVEEDKREVVEWCQQNDIFITAYRPIERGALTGSASTKLLSLAKKYGKTPAQIAINWLIAQENVVAIFKATKLEHIKENLGAVGWELTKEDFEGLTL